MRYRYVLGTRQLAFVALLVSALGLPAILEAQTVQVQLGEYGGTSTLVQTESGRYTWNGQPVFDGSTIIADNGNRYVLSFSAGEWSAGYLPRLVQVRLGVSDSSITLRLLENGQYWWHGLVESGMTFTAGDGEVYRLTYADGMWRADFVSQLVSVPLGRSGETVLIARLQTGGFSHDGRIVRNGLQVTDSSGNVYEFTLRAGSWHADPVAVVRPPPGGTGPDPAPVVRSDIRETFVGVEPILATGEDGVRRSVLKVGGAEYSVHELFSEGGVTRSPTFTEEAADTIESILYQIGFLEQAYGDDRTRYREAIELRWELAEDALEGLFGRSKARDIFGPVPLTRSRAVDTDEVIEILESAVDALSSYDEFYDALDDGVFEDALDTRFADDAFDAVQSVTKLKFGSTSNTRFGAYLRYERDGDGRWDDDLVLMNGDDGLGTFAYSPLDASRRGDLPRSGEAHYSGRTVAVPGDGELDTYSGIIELRVLFGSSRVTAQITDLRDENGDLWRYGFTDVDAINLPSARLDFDDASFEAAPTRSSNASVSYGSLLGIPRPRTLRSEFEGKFLGDGSHAGEAVIGTWSLYTGTSRDDPLLAGAFGAEFESTPVPDRPTVSDRGEYSETYIGAQPRSNGNIRLGGKDEQGEYLEFSASDLFADGYAESVGPTLISVASSEIERQIDLLDLWLRISDTESERDDRREDVWDSVNETLYEVVFGRDFRARNLLGRDYPTNSRRNADDRQARNLLLDAAEALSSVRRFEEALEEDGIFYEASDAASDPDLMFEVRHHDVRVEYRHSNYGRFGVWSRIGGTSAADGNQYDPQSPSGVFAYSPLEQATYLTRDPIYPTDGIAYYMGPTLAVDDSSDGPRIFEGEIGLTVQWGSDLDRASATSVIQNLRTVDRDRVFTYNGAAVDRIVFSERIRLFRGNGNGIEFDSTSPSVRITFVDPFLDDTRWTDYRSHTGKFVGQTANGPLGIIGTWQLGRSNSSVSLKGAYAADLAP